MKKCPDCDEQIYGVDTTEKSGLPWEYQLPLILFVVFVFVRPGIDLLTSKLSSPINEILFYSCMLIIISGLFLYIKKIKTSSVYQCKNCSTYFKGNKLEPFSYKEHYSNEYKKDKKQI